MDQFGQTPRQEGPERLISEHETPAGARQLRGVATVATDYAAVIAGRIGYVALSLASVVLLTRILSPSDYGALAFLTVVAGLLFTVTWAWTGAAVPRFGREELEHGRAMRAVSWNRFVLTAPLLPIGTGLLVLLMLVDALPPEFTWSFAWLAVALALVLALAEHVTLLLEGSGRMKLSGLAWLARQVIVVAALLVIFASGRGQSPTAVAIATIAAMLAVALTLSAAVWKSGFWPPTVDTPLRRRMLAFSLPLIAFTASQQVMAAADLVVIRAFMTAGDVGTYAVAYQGYLALQPVTAAAVSVFVPLLVSLRMANRDQLVRRYAERIVPQLLVIGAAVSGIGVSFVPLLAPVVFGASFEAATRPLVLLAGPLLLGFVASLLAPVLNVYDRTRELALVNVAAAAVNVIGDIVLIGVLGFGIEGAALATAAAVGVIALGYYRIVSKATGSVTPPRTALLVAPLFAGLLPALLVTGVWAAVIGVASAVAVTVVVVAICSPFDRADAELVASLDLHPRVKALALRGLAIAAR